MGRSSIHWETVDGWTKAQNLGCMRAVYKCTSKLAGFHPLGEIENGGGGLNILSLDEILII